MGDDVEGTLPACGLPTPSRGAHASAEHGACVMEYAALLSGDTHSDHPSQVHRLLATFCRTVNDVVGDAARSSLVRLVPALIGTAPRRGLPHIERAATDERVTRAITAVLDRVPGHRDPATSVPAPDPPGVPDRLDPGAGGGTAVLDRPARPSSALANPASIIRFSRLVRSRRSDEEIVELLETVVHAVRGALDLPPVRTDGPRPR